MKYHSKTCDAWFAIRNGRRNAFSLVEAATAVIILGLICSGVLVVIDRCMTSAADSALRMQAFDVARENMEKLLATEPVASQQRS